MVSQNAHLPHLSRIHKLVNYFRYVDDILLIFDSQLTDMHTILNDFNSIHPKLQFTDETEQNNKINYIYSCVLTYRNFFLICIY
jgi:hypothetical protein